MITIDDMFSLRAGFQAISKDRFAEILAETNGADRGYADQCWPEFRDAPMHYCCSRQPISQGEALLQEAIKSSNKPPHMPAVVRAFYEHFTEHGSCDMDGGDIHELLLKGGITHERPITREESEQQWAREYDISEGETGTFLTPAARRLMYPE